MLISIYRLRKVNIVDTLSQIVWMGQSPNPYQAKVKFVDGHTPGIEYEIMRGLFHSEKKYIYAGFHNNIDITNCQPNNLRIIGLMPTLESAKQAIMDFKNSEAKYCIVEVYCPYNNNQEFIDHILAAFSLFEPKMGDNEKSLRLKEVLNGEHPLFKRCVNTFMNNNIAEKFITAEVDNEKILQEITPLFKKEMAIAFLDELQQALICCEKPIIYDSKNESIERDRLEKTNITESKASEKNPEGIFTKLHSQAYSPSLHKNASLTNSNDKLMENTQFLSSEDDDHFHADAEHQF